MFPERVKHSTIDFHPGVAYGFEEKLAVDYFTNAFGAEESDAKAAVTLSKAECQIDEATVFANGSRRGETVLQKGKS